MTSHLPFQIDGIRYSECDDGDILEMVHVFAETFTRNDPPALAVGLTPGEFERFARIVSRSAAAEGLTIIARDAAAGAMVGALLAEDATNPTPQGMDALSAKFDAIFELFGQLEDQVPTDGPIAPGEFVHLFLLGVDARYARRGIGRRLVAGCLDNAAERGYLQAVTEATNLVSQHIFSKLGFVSRAEVSYAAYSRAGEHVFASIADQGGPKAMVLDITPKPQTVPIEGTA